MPGHSEAFRLLLRAIRLYDAGLTPDSTRQIRESLREAVRLDPNLAEAWALLGDVLLSDYLNWWNGSGEPQLREGEEAVAEALRLDPECALAHYASGFVHRAKGEHQEALEAFERAIEKDPDFARAYAQKAGELINLGRSQEVAALIERAFDLDPDSPSQGVFCWLLGRAYFFSGDYPDALPWLRRAVQARPNLWQNWLYLVSAHALAGQPDRAGKILVRFNALPQFSNPPCTLERVKSFERANPSMQPHVMTGRDRFHEGLLAAGMPAA